MHHHGVGDPLDAVILGDKLPYGYAGKVKVKGVMRFMDAGFVDDKLICTQLIQGNFLPPFLSQCPQCLCLVGAHCCYYWISSQ